MSLTLSITLLGHLAPTKQTSGQYSSHYPPRQNNQTTNSTFLPLNSLSKPPSIPIVPNPRHTYLPSYTCIMHFPTSLQCTHFLCQEHTDISHSHITLGGEHSVHNGLNSHPAKREFPICGLDVDIILSGQTKVRDLQHLVLPHQHIPAGKISVDNAQLRQEFLSEQGGRQKQY